MFVVSSTNLSISFDNLIACAWSAGLSPFNISAITLALLVIAKVIAEMLKSEINHPHLLLVCLFS